MAVTMRFITAPDDMVLSMLKRRTSTEGREVLSDKRPGAVGIFEAKLPDLYFYTDMAVKASSVKAVEITGNCPQHVSTVALVGEVSAVKQALLTIRKAEGETSEI